MFVSRLKHLGVHGAAALAFLAMGAPAPAADRATTIVVSQGSDVLTLDPMLDTSPISLNVFRNIFDALTRIAADGSVTPLLAKSWTTSEDTKTWEFKIRSNVTFHNGQPLTVEDVVWSYQRLAGEAKSPVRTYINKVKSVEAIGSGQGEVHAQRALCTIRPAGVFDLDPSQAGIRADRRRQIRCGTGRLRAVQGRALGQGRSTSSLLRSSSIGAARPNSRR